MSELATSRDTCWAKRGGYNELGFTKNNLYNHINKHRGERFEAAMSYLEAKGDNDTLLFCKYTVIEDARKSEQET